MFFVGGYYEAKTYNYSSEWLDQLESYAIMDINGTVSHGYAEYDEQGNPLEQTNFVFRGTTYDHAVFSWDGRQLAGISIRNPDDSVAATIAYQYNDQGYRISKVVTVGTTVETFTYDLLGSTIHREVYVRKVNGVTQDTYEIRYLIDSDGSILGFIYEDNAYYYLKDLQGDVISVIDEAGNELVQYEYDAYGNVINDPDDVNGDIFEVNPYTYRGYRFDSDIGMYYLNSRYYSPILSRFLNADGLLGELGDIASVNMYAYCAENPIYYTDPSGYRYIEGTTVDKNNEYTVLYQYYTYNVITADEFFSLLGGITNLYWMGGELINRLLIKFGRDAIIPLVGLAATISGVIAAVEFLDPNPSPKYLITTCVMNNESKNIEVGMWWLDSQKRIISCDVIYYVQNDQLTELDTPMSVAPFIIEGYTPLYYHNYK